MCVFLYVGPIHIDVVTDCRTDVIFVLDSSSSVGADNWEKVKTFVRGFLGQFTIHVDGVHVALVTYNNKVQDSFDLNAHNSTDSLQQAISSLAFSGGSTNTAAALWHVHSKILTPEGGDRSSVPNAVVLLTDGLSNYPPATVVSMQTA